MFQVQPETEQINDTPSPNSHVKSSRSPNFQPDLLPLQPVETPRIIRPTPINTNSLASLSPLSLSTIAEMLGERLPIFMFASRILFKQTLQGQLHIYEIQRQTILAQIQDLES